MGVAFGGAIYDKAKVTPTVAGPRALTLVQRAEEGTTTTSEPEFGRAVLGVDQIEAGGFDHLSLFSDLRVRGNVDLRLGQSLRLYGVSGAAIGMSEASSAGTVFNIQAPYLRLAQARWFQVNVNDPFITPLAAASDKEHGFLARADLIDLRDAVDLENFSKVALDSKGDVRLLRGISSSNAHVPTQLLAPSALDITAAQIYPTTNSRARIAVGLSIAQKSLGTASWTNSQGLLRIFGQGGVPAAPQSALGGLTLLAAGIEQGGVVRVPLGSLQLGGSNAAGTEASRVHLLTGSVTSTSAAGISIPYGGTTDGISWKLEGATVQPGLIGRTPDGRQQGVQLTANSITVDKGALLDMSGGGTLTGAGFVSGRGGSVDVLNHPLIDANPSFGFSAAGNRVYALLPSYKGTVAPADMAQGGDDPMVGQRVTVPAGVPGLAAGTYVLLPASYALQPGAYRVELGGASTMAVAPVATGTGSWRLSAQQQHGLGESSNVLFSDMLLTPADVVRRHSGYNETPYDKFVVDNATRSGRPRGSLSIDAGTLWLELGRGAGLDGNTAMSFQGDTRFSPAPESKGYGGSAFVTTSSRGELEILATGQSASISDGAAIFADALNALQPSRLVIGASASAGDSTVTVTASSQSLLVRSGATLEAAEVMLAALPGGKGITVEQGATITTLGKGKAAYDARDGYVLQGDTRSGTAIFALSNGEVNLLSGGTNARVSIDIGGCATADCEGDTRLVSEGSIGISTEGEFLLRDSVSYGTRRLGLSMSSINLGNAQALQAAASAGILPQGLSLNQQVLQQLLRGNTAIGAPALEALSLSARDAINVFGSVDLDTRSSATGRSAMRQLVLGAPAIHGYGEAGDKARIFAQSLIWDGTIPATSNPVSRQTQPTAAAMVDRLGRGQLEINADAVVLDRAPFSRPSSEVPADRKVLGFENLSFNVANQLQFGSKGSLSVHQGQGAYLADGGWQYTGGSIDINAPLITGAAGARLAVRTSGDLRIKGKGDAQNADALGAELSLQAQNIDIDGNVSLASGRLQANAVDSLTLGANARLDLSGRKIRLSDVERFSWGGDVELTAQKGSITAAEGSHINVSAQNNRAGRVSATALGELGGRVDLLGTLSGQASGRQQAGGSIVPYDSGELFLRARQLTDFSALNTRLDAGGFHGTRGFQFKEGDLTIEDTLRARNIAISMDGGSLRVAGRLDASGEQVGSIRLAARDSLQIDGMLDAHGTALRVDSYGKIIDSPNRAIVELTSTRSGVTFGPQAEVDLRSGTDVKIGKGAGQNDGVARGTLTINVPRVGTNDAAIQASSGIKVDGARDIFVNAFRRYDNAPLAAVRNVNGNRPQLITQAWLNDVVDPDSQRWMDASLANTALSSRMAALGKVRLRPGVEIIGTVSADNPKGDLTVSGDLDLSGYRYGPAANRAEPARRGFGESAALVLRAQGDLNIYGSINDGFAPPPDSPDDAGWLLGEAFDTNGNPITPLGGDIVVPIDGVTLLAGTRYRKDAVLNYAIPFAATALPAGTVLPVEMALGGQLQLAAGTVLPAAITTADGHVYAAGTLLKEPLQLQAGARLGAGFRLPNSTRLAAQSWPAGVPLPADLQLADTVTLAPGALIPSMTQVKLKDGKPVNLRPAGSDGRQGRNWALAALLPEGTTSWDLTAVAGADIDAADPRYRRPDATGDLILADSHYGTIGTARTTTTWVGAGRILTKQASLDWMGNESFAGKPVKEIAGLYGYSDDDFCKMGDYCAEPVRLLTKQASLDWMGNESFAGKPVKEIAGLYGYSDDDFCKLGDYCTGGGKLVEKTEYGSQVGTPMWSVVRTGMGDLQLFAARDVIMKSGYGVYTAGLATTLGGGMDAPFSTPGRASLQEGTPILGPAQGDGRYDAALAAWRAWYPDRGGNLTVAAGRDIQGDVWGTSSEVGLVKPDGKTNRRADYDSSSVSNWLWRQGNPGTGGADSTLTSWWINFGAYTRTRDFTEGARMVGFTGFGALGGGNIAIEAGRNAGIITGKGGENFLTAHSSAIVVAIGSTGRVTADNTLHLTGGGDLELRLGGALNPSLEATAFQGSINNQNLALNGNLINLRGQLHMHASRIGGIATGLQHYTALYPGLRQEDPFSAQDSHAFAGPTLVLGDAVATLQARGDVVLGGTADAGRTSVANLNKISLKDGRTAAGESWYSLWTRNTAVNLISAGGDLTPGLQDDSSLQSTLLGDLGYDSFQSTSGRVNYWLYPSKLSLLAANGSIRLRRIDGGNRNVLLTAPSADGSLEVLAMESILVPQSAPAISSSGADTRLPSPFDPAFNAVMKGTIISNRTADGSILNRGLFAFGPNLPRFADQRANGGAPNRFYAVNGDIIGLVTGNSWVAQNQDGKRSVVDWRDIAAPAVVRAGRDILVSNIGALNNTPTDITVVQAGRDIVQTNVTVAGPGNVEVVAGRQLRQEDAASVVSLGGIVQGDKRPGASVALTAGNQQINFAAIRARYLDPANRADPEQSLASQPGKAVKVYDKELKDWLKQRFGQDVDGADALAYFDALPSEQQRIFLRQVYYAELREGGREYNDADGPRFGSYLRGREAIATLVPDKDAAGNTIDRTGDIVMYGGAGVRTLFGGNIELMAPGGQIVVGVQGEVPPATAGLVTQGQGDIRLFSQDSVLLGLSRVMTTFGGDIFAWSEQGDINAGRGALTTLLYTPPRRVYDAWGNVTLAPLAPSSGAGIATLNPIPEVPPGDVDLIAPLGTIDAGEAGIRVSGNINLAALQVLNAANIQVQGESKGIPALAAVNVNALASASAAASSASQAAQDVMRKTQDDARRSQPSVISVEVLGFGRTSSLTPAKAPRSPFGNYDPDSAIQLPQFNEPEARLGVDGANKQ